jgi:uncharacterized protein YjbJ (UPF0337 family)
MGIPNRDEIKGKAKQAAGEAKRKDRAPKDDTVLEEAEGEVQQKSGDQKRQAGEAVEDQRERIRRNDRR